MADKLNVQLSLVVKNEDNSPFSSVTMDWASLPYEKLVDMQGALLQLLNAMHQWGVEAVKTKKAGG